MLENRISDYLAEAVENPDIARIKNTLMSIGKSFGSDYYGREVETRDGWLILDVRAYDYFTDRAGEEDDDHPRFTGEKALKELVLKKLEYNQVKGAKVELNPSEKSWVEIMVKIPTMTIKKPEAKIKSWSETNRMRQAGIKQKTKFKMSDFKVGDKIKVDYTKFKGEGGASDAFSNWVLYHYGTITKLDPTNYLVVDFGQYERVTIWPEDVLEIKR